ncbi:MAG: Ig-like domain-containing protein, partial [Actinomycetota bacterium]|nr:Ig-like domain-containing protein [Actinomycetota bacterium]
YMRFTGAATCSVNVSGGNGGSISTFYNGGPGGGGAGGVALVQGNPVSCPANVSNGVSGTSTSGVRGAGPTSLNSAGNTGLVTVNPTAFSAPVSAVTVPAAGALTNDSTPTISGTATADATVAVYIDGTLNGSTTANGAGTWTYTPTVALTSGAHTTYAIPTYLGIVGAQSASRSFSVDLAAPAAPSITTPSTNVVTTNVTPLIGGSAEADSTVRILDGATLLGTVTASGTGAWSFTPSAALTDGAHAITATATDAAGNTGAASATRTITIDTTPPGVVILSPTEGQFTPGETTAVSFTVTDANPGSSTCSTDGGPFGTCSSPYAAPTPTDGSHTVSVRHTDAVGNVTTATRTFITDTLAPSVAISTPGEGQALNDNTPTITFSATDLNLGAVTCAIDAGAFSACSSPYTPSSLTDGPHSVTVRAID